jgi:hypothetical protein
MKLPTLKIWLLKVVNPQMGHLGKMGNAVKVGKGSTDLFMISYVSPLPGSTGTDLVVQLPLRSMLLNPKVMGHMSDIQDGDLDLVKDASLSLAAHGQYMYVLLSNITDE